ncbi:MAG: tetratricopeptide repeat protein [Candidatus Nanoarchaeia archaeon]
MTLAGKNYLDKPGSYFFAVESGADITQLKDLQEQASKFGYTVLKATASPEYIFEKAFKDAKLDNYAKELQITSPAKLQRVFVITPAGKLASKKDAEDFNLESDVFASMLTAVSDFVDDALIRSGLTTEEPHKSLTKGNFTIEMFYNQNFTIAVIYEGHDPRIKDDIKRIHAKIDKDYGYLLREWDGVVTEQIQSLEDVLKENLFDTKKYTGKHDIATLKQLCEQRRWHTLEAIENLARRKKVLLYLDNVGDLDSTTIEDLYHIARNAKDKFTLVCTHYIDNIKDEPENKDLQNIIDKLKKEKLCETFEIKSQQSIYEILPSISENAKKVLQFAALGATGSALLKASCLSTADFANAYIELQGKRLLIDDRVATRKLATKIAEEITDKNLYGKTAEAIESVHKENLVEFAGVLFSLYAKIDNKEAAAKWAKTAAEYALKKADLVNALKWYRTLAQFALGEEKIESLKKAIELGFYQINDREGWTPVEEDIRNLENIAKQEGSIKDEAIAKLFRGKVYIRRADPAKALEVLESAGVLLNKIGEQDLYADLLNAKANALVNEGRYDEAVNILKELVDLTRIIGNKKIEAKALGSIGFALRRRNEAGEDSPELYREAINYFEQSLALTKITGDINLEAIMHDHLATLYARLNIMDVAREHLNLGIELCQQINNYKLLLSLLTTRGDMEMRAGNYESAEADNKTAETIASKIGDEMGRKRAIFNIAVVYVKKATDILNRVSSSPLPKAINELNTAVDNLSEHIKKLLEKQQ